MYDIIIVGAGPAGLTAAIYARRAEKSVLVLEKSTFGGQITFSPQIDNYPGVPSVSGNELADKLVDQALSQGAEIDLDTVTGIRKDADGFTVTGESGEKKAKAVILALGARHRMLGLDREAEFVGEGISYCAVCDGAFYRGKHVAVVGGGNSALQEALLLSELCEKVTIIQNLPDFTGEQTMVNKVRGRANIECIMGTVVTGVIGTKTLEGIVLLDDAGIEKPLSVDGMFVAIGLEPCNTPFSDLVPLNEYGYFDVGEDCQTATPGVFVAGDCRSKRIRQITTATADGAAAALAACRYLEQ